MSAAQKDFNYPEACSFKGCGATPAPWVPMFYFRPPPSYRYDGPPAVGTVGMAFCEGCRERWLETAGEVARQVAGPLRAIHRPVDDDLTTWELVPRPSAA